VFGSFYANRSNDTELAAKQIWPSCQQSPSCSYHGIQRLGAYFKAMQELSGTAQMTLLIIFFGLSAYVFFDT
jgi:hypothetical protein